MTRQEEVAAALAAEWPLPAGLEWVHTRFGQGCIGGGFVSAAAGPIEILVKYWDDGGCVDGVVSRSGPSWYSDIAAAREIAGAAACIRLLRKRYEAHIRAALALLAPADRQRLVDEMPDAKLRRVPGRCEMVGRMADELPINEESQGIVDGLFERQAGKPIAPLTRRVP